jgi:hypothetical protein
MRSWRRRNGADRWDLAGRKTGADDRQDPTGNAMSWLTDCIIEGFAAYASLYYPWQHEHYRRFGEDFVQSERHELRSGSPSMPSIDADLSGAVVVDRRGTGGGG